MEERRNKGTETEEEGREREQKKKEREEQQKAGKGRGCGRGCGSNKGKEKLCYRRRLQLVILESDTGTNSETSDVGEQDGGVSEQDDDGVREQDDEPGPSSSRPSRHRQNSSCYHRDSSGSEGNDGTLCSFCQNNEPEGLASGVVF